MGHPPVQQVWVYADGRMIWRNEAGTVGTDVGVRPVSARDPRPGGVPQGACDNSRFWALAPIAVRIFFEPNSRTASGSTWADEHRPSRSAWPGGYSYSTRSR